MFSKLYRGGRFAGAARCFSDANCGAKSIAKLDVRLEVRLVSATSGNPYRARHRDIKYLTQNAHPEL